jgi:hypothetical protein
MNIAPATIIAPISTATMINARDVLPSFGPQHCLYFNPLPQVQGLFRPVFILNSFVFRNVERRIIRDERVVVSVRV